MMSMRNDNTLVKEKIRTATLATTLTRIFTLLSVLLWGIYKLLPQ